MDNENSDNLLCFKSAKHQQIMTKLDVFTNTAREQALTTLLTFLDQDNAEWLLDNSTVEDWLELRGKFLTAVRELGDKVSANIRVNDPGVSDLDKLVEYYKDNCKTMPKEDAALRAAMKPARDRGESESFIESNMFSFATLADMIIQAADSQQV